MGKGKASGTPLSFKHNIAFFNPPKWYVPDEHAVELGKIVTKILDSWVSATEDVQIPKDALDKFIKQNSQN